MGTTQRDVRYEVVVIGAGQAGLAIGHFLARQGRRFVVLEADEGVGSAWRTRWDSLRLFTPRRYDALPGLAFPGDPDGHPTRDEVLSYLEQYVATFELPIEPNARVRSLRRDDGRFAIALDGRTLEGDQVVVATGAFQVANVPPVAEELAPEVTQLRSTGYRRPENVPEGTVLVVGGGNTGYQIAQELSATRSVHLAVGSRQTPLPQRFLGRDVFWWLTKTGLLSKTVESRLGRRLRGRDTLIGSSPRALRRHGVTMRPRVVGAIGRTLRFADETEIDVDAVVWATGFRPDYSWLEVPVVDPRGHIRHRRGVTDVPGLYFLGLSWQHTRGSALLGFVADDAEFLASEIGKVLAVDAREGGALGSTEPAPAAATEGA